VTRAIGDGLARGFDVAGLNRLLEAHAGWILSSRQGA
jgi:hypothetical protein